MRTVAFVLCMIISGSESLLPPKYQWKTIDFAWDTQEAKDAALFSGDYVPHHNMPSGLARWKDKLFITIPRWKKGVPSSLNYITIGEDTNDQSPALKPYPNWGDAFVKDSNPKVSSNGTVVSTFRIYVDVCDRLWAVDNGVSDIANAAVQVTSPALVIFDLKHDQLIHRFEFPKNIITNSSVFTSVVVDTVGKECDDEAYAYITDMGSNALIVFSLKTRDAWRIQHPHFNFDPTAGVYKVGGVNFYWNDGLSAVALSKPGMDGHRELFLHSTSSTKQFKMSTKLLRNKEVSKESISNGVELVGDRGPKSQSTACDYDPQNNVLFYTLLSKNGFGCWNIEKPYDIDNTPLVMSDCGLLEFPNDIKVDQDGNLWVLSNRQSKFLYERMNFDQVNFRILTAPVSKIIQDTPCMKSKLTGNTTTKKKSSLWKSGSWYRKSSI